MKFNLKWQEREKKLIKEQEIDNKSELICATEERKKIYKIQKW